MSVFCVHALAMSLVKPRYIYLPFVDSWILLFTQLLLLERISLGKEWKAKLVLW